MEFHDLLYKVPALLVAISIHEYAHAKAAQAFGDLSPALLGRASLNPLRHLDPLGTICLLILNFGWARPVPINPANFNRRRLGLFCVSLAGPVSNLLMAFVLGYLFKVFGPFWGPAYKIIFYAMLLNVGLGLFNLIPLPPLDGFHVVESLFEKSPLIGWLNSLGPLVLITIIILDNLAHTGVLSSVLVRPMFRLMLLFGGQGMFAPLMR